MAVGNSKTSKSKFKTIFICTNCGYDTHQWVGQCPNCGEWNTLKEDAVLSKPLSGAAKVTEGRSYKPVALSDISLDEKSRLDTGISEFNRVLGGGFVPGQVVLLAGAPGIGKSTLLTQTCAGFMKANKGATILYVCGEESPDQVKLRAQRMNISADQIYLYQDSSIEGLINTLEQQSYSLVIVDSIQTSYSTDITGTPGSISQVRGSAQLLTALAKQTSTPIIIVGHVTKEGTVAGPKVLEHIVDTVLYLEGDAQHLFRLLKTTKNRFGSVSEVGIFEMTQEGMREVKNPSEVFISGRDSGTSGSCLTAVMEGQRALLYEIQALTIKTQFGYPRRTTSGFSTNRLQVILAILEKRSKVNVGSFDVYLNVAGGLKVSEYSVDLAACLAIASAVYEKPLKEGSVAFGEVGLNGEIRNIPHLDKLIKEAQTLGYTNIISPKNTKTLAQALKHLG